MTIDPDPAAGKSGIFSRFRSLFRRRADAISVAEKTPVTATSAEGQALEQRLYANIARLSILEAVDVMVPRADIIAIDSKSPTAETLSTIRAHRFLRFPVYRHTLDEMTGYIEIRRVLDLLAQNKPLDLYQILEKPLFIVRSTRILDVLMQMRQTHIYLAIVVDEYGGVDGLLTIEDVTDAITGSVEAEGAFSSSSILPQSDGQLLVDARTELAEFENKLGRTLSLEDGERDEIDTIGGLVFLLLGRIPARGEVVPFDAKLHFEVVDADSRRLKWLRAVQKTG